MSNTITIGSYYHTQSLLHRMDPRIKLVLMIIFMVSVFVAEAPWGLIPVIAMLVLIVWASNVPVRIVFRALRPLWFFVVLTAIINIFLVRDGNVLFHFLGFGITDHALYQCVFMAFRIFSLMMIGVIFTLTTSPISLADGLERLLSPLERLGAPISELAMMYTIAIRFVPTLFDETQQIMNAQAARGASLDDGRFIDRIRFFVPILVPLFASALRHAEELANAMEARCYEGGEGRTHYHILTVRRLDWASMGIMAIYLALLVVINVLL